MNTAIGIDSGRQSDGKPPRRHDCGGNREHRAESRDDEMGEHGCQRERRPVESHCPERGNVVVHYRDRSAYCLRDEQQAGDGDRCGEHVECGALHGESRVDAPLERVQVVDRCARRDERAHVALELRNIALAVREAHHSVLDQQRTRTRPVEKRRGDHDHARHEQVLVDLANHADDVQSDLGLIGRNPAGVILVRAVGPVVDRGTDVQTELRGIRPDHDLVRFRGVEHAPGDDDRTVHVAEPHLIRGHEERRFSIEPVHHPEGEVPARDLRDLRAARERGPVRFDHAYLAGKHDRVGRAGPASQPGEGSVGAAGAREGCNRESECQSEQHAEREQ